MNKREFGNINNWIEIHWKSNRNKYLNEKKICVVSRKSIIILEANWKNFKL